MAAAAKSPAEATLLFVTRVADFTSASSRVKGLTFQIDASIGPWHRCIPYSSRINRFLIE